jgi:hypothetical protein
MDGARPSGFDIIVVRIDGSHIGDEGLERLWISAASGLASIFPASVRPTSG